MKKIISGLLSIAVALGLTAGAGYALANNTAKLDDVSFAVNDPGLLISTDNVGADFTQLVDGLNVSGFTTPANLNPGDSETGTFYLRNDSGAPTTLKGQIVGSDGTNLTNWATLAPLATLSIAVGVGTPVVHTLQDWYNGGTAQTIDALPTGVSTITAVLSLPSTGLGGVLGQAMNFNFTFSQ